MDSSYVPTKYFNDLQFKQISRCILLTNKTIYAHEKTTPEENVSCECDIIDFLIQFIKLNNIY